MRILAQTQGAPPPQRKVDEFWRKFTARTPGKATTLLPRNELATRLAKRSAAAQQDNGSTTSASRTRSTTASYEEAAALCRAKVDQIVAECRRVNQKYRDPHFDLDFDLRSGVRDCLESLSNRHADYRIKRVGEIFDDPRFYIDGPTANDVRQGRDGDCWLMAALCTLSNKPGLIERVCVAHNEDVGVYGFVFHRDGEWFSEIIDDHLYLLKPDYDEACIGRRPNVERYLWEDIERADSEEKYRQTYQSNSEALYFAQCENKNETWLPLLEKAYAKAHGDYAAIEGGWTGEGIEDLTGGITAELFTADILDKELFWQDLMRVNKDFLFSCSTGLWGLGYGQRKGIREGHAYSVMRAVEVDGQRLLLLKNPWGKGEWTGPWSDGSKEWTPEWLTKLNHRFGDDGVFWISYKDLLRKYQYFDRTRLFGPGWTITLAWTTLNVSWAPEYHDTKFSFTLAKSGSVVLVLSQLDDRYFRGLEGEYIFGLGFRVHKAGQDDYLVRSHTTYSMNRSCNVELDLDAGEYTVLVRIDAERVDGVLPAEEVVRLNAKERREKLLRIGLAYDLAHSKARVVETAEEKAARKAFINWRKEKRRAAFRKQVNAELRIRRYFQVDEWASKRRDAAWRRKVERYRAEKRQAKHEAKFKAAQEGARQARQKTAEGPVNSSTQASPQPEAGATNGKEEGPKELSSTETQGEGNQVKSEGADPSRPAAKPADDQTKSVEQSELITAVGASEEANIAPHAAFYNRLRPPPRGTDADSDFSEDGPSHGRPQPGAPYDSDDDDEDLDPSSDICSIRSFSTVSDTWLDYRLELKDKGHGQAQSQAEGDTPPPSQTAQAGGGVSYTAGRGGPSGYSSSEDELDEFERDPWNAVAVVGLRIYFKPEKEKVDGIEDGPAAVENEGDLVKIRVVRPNRWEIEDDSDKEEVENEKGKGGGRETKEKGKEGKGDETKVLDVDDSAKDAAIKAA
ncbi:calpain-B [Corynascus novoguineensis]|uniref:Calpain-B n=1 Tax=Corynascus novoguineensis TaxID=1126955 RepID=A0AAN7CX07_9PEZI|nr:calpain-B [Corynascus novoguineensis]